jgi:hypothetical protein
MMEQFAHVAFLPIIRIRSVSLVRKTVFPVLQVGVANVQLDTIQVEKTVNHVVIIVKLAVLLVLV